jgi:hypothetical protein
MAATQQGLGFTPMGITPQSYQPTTQSVSGRQRAFGYKPAQQQAQLLADTDISQYQNPYQQQVIDMAMRDIGSAQQQALMQQGAQAQQARAFGGSRQGVAEAETRLGYGQQAADTAARLRQQGFQQAQQAAMFDVGQGAAWQHPARTASAGCECGGADAGEAIRCAGTCSGSARQLGGAAVCDGNASWSGISARRTWPAGIRHRAGDPAAADAAGAYAADVAAVSDRRGARPICGLHRRTAGGAFSTIGGVADDAKTVNVHNAEPSWIA